MSFFYKVCPMATVQMAVALVFVYGVAPAVCTATTVLRPDKGSATEHKHSEAMVRAAWVEAVAIFGSNQPAAEKKRHFRQWIRKYFNVVPSARFSLRNNWKKLSDAQRQKYLSLFLSDLSNTYFGILATYYHNDELVILKSKSGKDSALGSYILSEIKRQNGQTIPVKWRVRGKILDVTVSEASPSNAKREEYQEIMRKNGNTIEGFLQALEKKVHAMEEDTHQ